MINLFGEEQSENPVIIKKPHGHYKTFRAEHWYKKSSDKSRRCQFCINIIQTGYHGRNYYKCKIQGISSCHSSDIRKSYVCDQFIKGELNVQTTKS